MVSSVVDTCKVNRGGIKKKFQVKALSAAANRTGKISKVMASNETVNNKISATTLYPRNPDNPKQIPDTIIIIATLNRYCLPLGCFLNRKFLDFHSLHKQAYLFIGIFVGNP